MALLGNFVSFNKTPGRFIGGLTVAQTMSNFNSNGSNRNLLQGLDSKTALGAGYLPPYSWAMPTKDGGLASTQQSSGAIAPSAQLAGGRNLIGSANLVLTLTNAQLDQIVTFIASANLVMAQQNAALSAAVSAVASSTMVITPSAALWALFGVSATSSMAITPNAFLSALANIQASAGGPTPLSPEGLAQAVWDSLITDYSTPGTVGYTISDIKVEVLKRLDKGTFIALK